MAERTGTLRVLDGRLETVSPKAAKSGGKKGTRSKSRPAPPAGPAESVHVVSDWRRVSSHLIERAMAAGRLEQLDGVKIAFELNNRGEPCSVTEKGAAYSPPEPELLERASVIPLAAAMSSVVSVPPRRAPAVDSELAKALASTRRPRVRAQPDPPQAEGGGDFHNPYAFIPIWERQIDDPLLGDHQPLGHHRLAPAAWSGTIDITLTTVTPMLLPDHASVAHRRGGDRHKVFTVARGPDGRPFVAPTAVKGMLRSAFEAATNSRMGVFGQTDPITGRMTADEAQAVAGAIVELDSGALVVQNALAWRLPRYKAAARPLKYEDDGGGLPAHGDDVWALAGPTQQGGARYVKKIWRAAGNARPADCDLPAEPGWAVERGWVMVSGEGAATKKHERVFVPCGTPRVFRGPAAERMARDWGLVVRSYHDAIKQPGAIQAAGVHHANGYDDLRAMLKSPGSRVFCWQLDLGVHAGRPLIALLPAMVSRRTFTHSPYDALHPSLRPARTLDELSPADRLFGWVHDERGDADEAAYRGQLRVGPVHCEAPNAVQDLSADGVPLAILSSPKVQQALFYASDSDGWRLRARGESRWNAYQGGSGPRGRKVYPHQSDERDWTGSGEHRRASDLRDSQNVSMRGWVKPHVAFTCTLHVVNLNDAELGALLWLLRDDAGHLHKLGGGKPLGFGSVRARASAVRVQRGDQIAAAVRALDLAATGAHSPELEPADIARLVDTFNDSAERIVNARNQPPHLVALTQALAGRSGLTHYPRTRTGGPIYEWFGENTAGKSGAWRSLPDLRGDDARLPSHPRV